MAINKRMLMFAVIALVAIGIIVAIVVATSGGDDADGGFKDVDDSPKIDKGAILTPGKAEEEEPSSDPDSATVAFTLLAIGDWGGTTFKDGSCCDHYRIHEDRTTQSFFKDYHAQVNIAKLLAQSAGEMKPEAILGHGDNLYWNGVGSEDAVSRMKITWEGIYDDARLQGIPWFNVAGNHDIGGSTYLCGPSDSQFRPCSSTKQLLAALDYHFTGQRDYEQINPNWIMSDHFYKKTIEKNGVSVDIFNIDTNYADSHAARQVCCQCYGYKQGASFTCSNVERGNQFCAGGSTEMYDACMGHIKGWWDDSIEQLSAGLEASTATFKVINTHYSPHFHMGEDKMKVWYEICSKYGVHIWMNGHTHGFNHDISYFNTHFFENGGGGGIQSQASGNRPEIAAEYVETEWIGSNDPYGFFELSFSEDWIKVQFVTFDNAWVFQFSASAVTEGGMQRDHCWHVPRTGGPGKEC